MQPELRDLVKLPENRFCADCRAADPRWASVNLGIFICDSCAGIHRGLGAHITKVRSVRLDEWKPEWVDLARRIGNERSNAYFEYDVPEGYRFTSEVSLAGGDKLDAQQAQQLRLWITAKYELRKFVPAGVDEPRVRVERGESLETAHGSGDKRRSSTRKSSSRGPKLGKRASAGASQDAAWSWGNQMVSSEWPAADAPNLQMVASSSPSVGSGGWATPASSSPAWGSFTASSAPVHGTMQGGPTPSNPTAGAWGSFTASSAPTQGSMSAVSSTALPNAATTSASMLPGAEEDILWRVQQEELQEYRAMFARLDPTRTGFVGSDQAKDLFESSKLPVTELSHIWKISDMDGDRQLAQNEFIYAMILLARRRCGAPLPQSIPLQLRLIDSVWTASREEVDGYCAQFQSLALGGSEFADNGRAKVLFEGSGLPHQELSRIWKTADVDGDGRLSLREFLCSMVLIARRLRGAPLPEALPSELLASLGKFVRFDGRSSSPWAISTVEILKYRALFNYLDETKTGLDSEDVLAVFETSGLHVEELTRMWDLIGGMREAPIGFDHFSCLVHLISRRRQGLELPATCPLEFAERIRR